MTGVNLAKTYYCTVCFIFAFLGHFARVVFTLNYEPFRRKTKAGFTLRALKTTLGFEVAQRHEQLQQG